MTVIALSDHQIDDLLHCHIYPELIGCGSGKPPSLAIDNFWAITSSVSISILLHLFRIVLKLAYKQDKVVKESDT